MSELISKNSTMFQKMYKIFTNLLFTLFLPSLLGCNSPTVDESPLNKSSKMSAPTSYMPHGKTRGHSQVNLVFEEQNQKTLIHADVKAWHDIANGFTKWKLPKSLQIIDGEIETESSFTAGKTHRFTITVKTSSLNKMDKVFFYAYQMKNGVKQGTPAMIVYGQERLPQPLLKQNKSGKRQKIYQ